jgi:3-hydroxyacyl-[acyl-carrier-protein] dehydratase
MSDGSGTSQVFPDPEVVPVWDGRQLDIQQVCELLPHRPPFLMVDKIIELQAGQRAVGLKAVTMNEWFFAGHYPGHPVMPGVLLLEALAQVSGIVVLTGIKHDHQVPYFTGIKEAKFRRPVRPGDLLRLEAEVEWTSLRFSRLMTRTAVRALVDGELVCEAVCSFALIRPEA